MDNVIYANKNHIPLNWMCGKVNNMLGTFCVLIYTFRPPKQAFCVFV